MLISSEYVTLGHPDRLCDTIASNLINKIQVNDRENSHAAIEVFASDDTVVFGGESKTTLKINNSFLKNVLDESFKDAGYIPARRNIFTKDEVYLAKDTKIVNKIHAQSPDIAMATTDKKEASGFNDQGIFFGAYDSMTPTGQGVAKYLAQSFGDYLFNKSLDNLNIGSDIKVVFTIDVDKDLYTPKSIEHVTVAIPNKNIDDSFKKEISIHLERKGLKNDDVTNIYGYVVKAYFDWTYKLSCELKESFPLIYKLIGGESPMFTVNGTGRYVNHGYHSDASMTGRKLAVNNMSAGPITSQCQCGGGSYIKPFHASDFLLPMVGNMLAKTVVDLGLTPYANVALACTIGSTKVDSICITGDAKFNKNTKLQETLIDYFVNLDLSPDGLAKRWGYPGTFDFYAIAKSNFVDANVCPWYNTDKIKAPLEIILKEGK